MEGQPPYRLEQVQRALAAGLEPGEMTVLPMPLRERLSEQPAMRPAFRLASESASDHGATLKWLLEATSDGAPVEAVLMRYPDRITACVSSQAGCAMACSFCATGQMGFRRQLSVGEILEQIVRASRAAREKGWGRLTNVVFMGMGEPMANYEGVMSAVRRANGDLPLAARGFTISTVGIVPGIRRLAADPLQVNLAVSLHAANDDLRASIVPINRRYGLSELMAACLDYADRTQRRISFEWALIAGTNDRAEDAAELARLLSPLGSLAHVNLIPLNPTPGFLAVGSDQPTVRSFRDRLKALGLNTTIRDTRGRSVGGACGQLAGGARLAASVELA